MTMDREYEIVKSLARSQNFQQLLFILFHKNWLNFYSKSWEDRAQYTADEIMEEFDCVTLEGPIPRSLVIYPNETRRKKPACIVVHSQVSALSDFTVSVNAGLCVLEVVEAGKYDVARLGSYAYTGPETEG